jgi:diaminopimelate decarboxylase
VGEGVLMEGRVDVVDSALHGFVRRDGVLTCRGVSLEELAREHGTPLYVYDLEGVAERLRRYLEVFREVDFLLAYSVKANGNLALLNRIGALGAGADIVSRGELHRARTAGIPPERIVYAGVGKGEDEMEAALEAGIHAFHVESEGELDRLEEVAARMGRRAPVALRVNPDVLSPTPHEYTRTGHATTQFGIAHRRALEIYRERWESASLYFRGIDVHIGSQIMETGPYVQALHAVLEMVDALAEEGRTLEYVDLGGGFGVAYEGGEPFPLDELARAVVPPLRERGLRLILEPGRSLVAEAGVLLARVRYVKESGGKTFVIMDGGMTALIRPSHYGGYHRIVPVREVRGAPTRKVDVVGPACETGDFLARDRELPLPEPGELLAVEAAGAYGFVMASNYNARRRPAEILVEGGIPHLIRRRETLDDLIRGEEIPE